MGSIKQDLKDATLGFVESAHDKWVDLRQFTKEAWPLLIFLFVCLMGIWWYADPPPPRHIYMATGSSGGSYEVLADKYVAFFKKNGIKVELVATSGAQENIKRLADHQDPVQVAFVQAGVFNPADIKGISSLGAVDYEPVWFFYRGPEVSSSDFERNDGRMKYFLNSKISIGQKGSGTYAQAIRILEVSGLSTDSKNLLTMPSEEAIGALKRGEIDGLFLVDGYQSKNVQALFADPSLHLSAYKRAEAYSKLLPYLRILDVPMGSFSLINNLPDRDIQLLSTTTNLLVDDRMHPALQFLFLEAARQINGEASFFAKEGEFPSFNTYGIPESPVALHYEKNGSPFILSYFPFWLAELINRLIFVFLPFCAIAYPVLLALPGYRTKRMRRRIIRLYITLKKYEQELIDGNIPEMRDEYLRKLDLLEHETLKLKVPSGMSSEYYSLRSDIEYVRSCLNRDMPLYQR